MNFDGTLVFDHRLVAIGEELFLVHCLSGAENDEGNDGFAEAVIAFADDCRLTNLRMVEKNLIHVARINVVSADENHVFLAIDERDITVVVDESDVAAVDPSVAERFCSLFGIVPIINIVSCILDFMAYNKLNTQTIPGVYKTMQFAAILEIVTILSGNIVSLVFGIINLNNLNNPAVTNYLKEKGIY